MKIKTFSKLKGLLTEHGLRQRDYIEILGCSQTYLTNRLTRKQPFNLNDIYLTMDYFGLPHTQISEYFPAKD